MAIDNMYDLAAIGELLEQKGVLTKKEIIALAEELKRKTPATEFHTASTIDTPPPQRFTDMDNAVIEQIMAARPIKPRRSYSIGMGKTVNTRDASGECLGPLFLFFTRFCRVDDLAIASLGLKTQEVIYEIRIDWLAPRNHLQ